MSALANGVSGAGLLAAVLNPGAVEAFEIAIRTASLSSPKEGIDKNMHKALKAAEFKDITFRLLRLEAKPALRAIGMLKIAGVEREVAFDLKTTATATALTVTGEVSAAHDRLRHRAAEGHARHVEDGSQDHGEIRSGPCGADDPDPLTRFHHDFIQEDMTMTRTLRFATALAAVLALAAPAAAQDTPNGAGDRPARRRPRPIRRPATEQEEKDKADPRLLDEGSSADDSVPARPGQARPERVRDDQGTGRRVHRLQARFQRGVHVAGAESRARDDGAAQSWSNGVNANQLANIGFGFNNSAANLYVNAQLAPGIRVTLTSYLSSRHHNETWVKDGYIQIDQSPIDWVPAKMLFEIATIRVGHMEINYGDAHFRRSDNGNALYNPFVGNYIMDAFTTEIGGEAYLKIGSAIAMAAITGGEIRGTVLTPEQRGPAFIGKLGFDRQVNTDLRVRLTGSLYKTKKALSNTLYGGDRAGSRYFWVMENTAATESANATSGYINPGFRNQVTAMQIEPVHQVPRRRAVRRDRAVQGTGRHRGGRSQVEPLRGRRGLSLPGGREVVRRRALQPRGRRAGGHRRRRRRRSVSGRRRLVHPAGPDGQG